MNGVNLTPCFKALPTIPHVRGASASARTRFNAVGNFHHPPCAWGERMLPIGNKFSATHYPHVRGAKLIPQHFFQIFEKGYNPRARVGLSGTLVQLIEQASHYPPARGVIKITGCYIDPTLLQPARAWGVLSPRTHLYARLPTPPARVGRETELVWEFSQLATCARLDFIVTWCYDWGNKAARLDADTPNRT